MDFKPLPPGTENLTTRAGLGEIFSAEPLAGGANNRAFRLTCQNREAVLKCYFRDAADRRDRLDAEYAFLRFAWSHGIRCIPKPLGCSRENGLALYSLVPGRPLAPGQITGDAVKQALEFFLALNRHRDATDAPNLPAGSEACFSLSAHLETVTARISRLNLIEGNDVVDHEAREFIAGELSPLWANVATTLRNQAVTADIPLKQPIADSQKCLSPSDFGFHNALIDSEGRITFLDFEYAGWDDPAKTVGDFFNQVAHPVSLDHFALFAFGIATLSQDPEKTLKRMRLLMPVYGCKWVCIILNEFLPGGARRRRFADEERHTDPRREQLDKARLKLAHTLKMADMLEEIIP